MKFSLNKIITFLCGAAILGSCSADSQKFIIGECLIPKAESSPEKIIKVVAVGKEEYKFFTYFLSGGKLMLAQDYQAGSAKEIESNYIKVECPVHEGEFSPDEYLNENKK